MTKIIDKNHTVVRANHGGASDFFLVVIVFHRGLYGPLSVGPKGSAFASRGGGVETGFVLEPLRKAIATCDFQGESGVSRGPAPPPPPPPPLWISRLLPMNILDVFLDFSFECACFDFN